MVFSLKWMVQVCHEFIKPMSLWNLQLTTNRVKCWSPLNGDEDLVLANLIICTFIQLQLSFALMLWRTGRGNVQLMENSVSSFVLRSTATTSILWIIWEAPPSFSPSPGVTVTSDSEAGIIRHKGTKKSQQAERKTAFQMMSYAPCSDLRCLNATWPHVWSTVVHYTEGAVRCLRVWIPSTAAEVWPRAGVRLSSHLMEDCWYMRGDYV